MSYDLPTDKELTVLNLLIGAPEKELYGLQMVKEDEQGEGRPSLRRSSIYVILTRMVARGYLGSRLETIEEQEKPGPQRRLYKITAFGQAMQVARVKADAAIDPLIEEAKNLKPAGAMR